MLKSKCIYEPVEESDWLRISVMNRHTLDDWKTPDPAINESSFQEHRSALAPSNKLLGDYYKRGLSFEEYEKRFTQEMQQAIALSAIQQLISLSLVENVTILCKEETPEFCHRRLLVNICKQLCEELGTRVR